MTATDLEAAYRTTDYVVEAVSGHEVDGGEQPLVLRTDTASQQLRVLHRRYGVDCSCFITAYNPLQPTFGRTDQPAPAGRAGS